MSDLRVDAHVGEDPDDLDNHVLRVACVKGVYKGVQLFFYFTISIIKEE